MPSYLKGSVWRIEQHCLPDVPMQGEQRAITVAVPADENQIPLATVLYCADGQYVPQLAERLQPSLAAGELGPLALCGLHSVEDVRADDYLCGGNDRFFAHEAYFVGPLRSWFADRYRATPTREQSVLFGFSNGGAFAVALALRHPTLYAAAVAFSVPPLPVLPPWLGGAAEPAFYLAVGDHGPERQIRKRMLQLAQWLRKQGLRTEFADRRGARHTLELWGPELVLAAKWLQDARRLSQGVDPGR